MLKLLRRFTALASPKLVPDFIAQRSLLGRFATPALRAAHVRALSHVSSRTLTARLRAMADVDARDALRAVKVPALYLRATEDRVVAARFAEEFAAHAHAGSVLDIDGPHLLLQANPHDSARHIIAFIAALTSAGARDPHAP